MTELATIKPTATDPLTDAMIGLCDNTRKAYGKSFADFGSFLGVASGAEAAKMLFSLSGGEANVLAAQYRASMIDRKLSSATINARLGALSGISIRLHRYGVITWLLDVEGVERKPYRDTAGPGEAAIKKMLDLCEDNALGRRNRAILQLLFNPALRRSEVVSIDVGDIDFERWRLNVKGKGRHDKEPLTLPHTAIAAIRDWLVYRGDEPGPLFIRLDRSAPANSRVSAQTVYEMVREIGERAGVDTHPHALRHGGITCAAQATNGNMLAVAAFGRHKSMDTSRLYIDNAADVAGQTAHAIAARKT